MIGRQFKADEVSARMFLEATRRWACLQLIRKEKRLFHDNGEIKPRELRDALLEMRLDVISHNTEEGRIKYDARIKNDFDGETLSHRGYLTTDGYNNQIGRIIVKNFFSEM